MKDRVFVTVARDRRTKTGGRGGGLLALVFLDVPAVPLRNSSARKIAAKDDHLWNKIVFDAVVKDLL
jgi:hypothetical protein